MDDELTIRNVVGAMLKTLGYTISFAVEGQEAVTKYQQAIDTGHPFDIVIMDLTIPGGMGGKEATQEILSIDAAAKIIVSSGYANGPVMSNYKEFGFKGIIVKPYRMKELRSVIRQVLEVQEVAG